LKTFPDSSPRPEEPTLQQWLEKWLEPNSLYRKTNGKTPEWRLDPGDSSSGQFWTRNGSEFRNGAVASSLSEILETGEVDRRYFLSAKACQGILRRAEKRGKALPTTLRLALEQVAEGSKEPETPEAKIASSPTEATTLADLLS